MISANLKTKIMRTNEEVKELCIKELETLIQSIKDDKISDNYVFAMDIIERENNFEFVTDVVRYSITRNEYTCKQTKYKH